MLNLWITHEDDTINGATFKVPKEDITEPCKREVGCDLIPLYINTWPGDHDSSIREKDIAYTFIAHHDGACANHDIVPIRQYYEMTKDGASTFGEDFLNAWNNSTYLADRITLIREWCS